MSFGKVFTSEGNARTLAIRAVAKDNKVDIEYVDYTPLKGHADYIKLNPLNKIPSFEGADGYVLTEAMAIAIYITSQNEKTTLLGKTKQDYASILRWMSFANTEVLPPMGGWFLGMIGRAPYNKKASDESLERGVKALTVLDKHLLVNTFLVGERMTLADLFTAGVLTRVFQFYMDEKNRKAYPCLTRFFETVTNQPLWVEANGKPIIATEVLKYTPPAKTEQPKKGKAAAEPKAAKAAAAADDEEDEQPVAPKPKHPLEALGRPTLVLDDWKRKYSNAETREEALPWFWENFKPEEYSLWSVDYKYNPELTMTFMTSNLIGGFFARLEASRKYLFGCCSVYGVTNDSIIKGAFLVRGQEALPAFDVAPDYESYEFKKLDHTNAADREFVNDQWAWDKPVVVGGKSYEWADGKVFK